MLNKLKNCLCIIILFICFTNNIKAQWTKLYTGVSENLNDVFFVDSKVGYAVGLNGLIIKTIDGGVSWNKQTSGTNNPLYSIYFTDFNTGYIAGYRWLLKTTDGGKNWISHPKGLTYLLSGIFFTDKNTGYMVGGGGIVLKTTDAGLTWYPKTSDSSPHSLSAVYFPSKNIGYAVGNGITMLPYAYYGKIRKTIDAGENWVDIYTQIQASYSDVYFKNDSVGYVYDYGKIINTNNYGTNWNNFYSYTSAGQFSSIAVVSDSVSYLVSTSGQIFKTNNGGLNWTIDTTLNNTSKCHFVNKNLGFVCGNNGTIYKYYVNNDIFSNNFFVYPNPTSNQININYSLNNDGVVTIEIYNLFGQLVATLDDSYQQIGNYNKTFNLKEKTISSGYYIIKAKLDEVSYTFKLIYTHY